MKTTSFPSKLSFSLKCQQEFCSEYLPLHFDVYDDDVCDDVYDDDDEDYRLNDLG